jgi:hypothetical protein
LWWGLLRQVKITFLAKTKFWRSVVGITSSGKNHLPRKDIILEVCGGDCFPLAALGGGQPAKNAGFAYRSQEAFAILDDNKFRIKANNFCSGFVFGINSIQITHGK